MERIDIDRISRRTFLASASIAASVPLLQGATEAAGAEAAGGGNQGGR